MKVTIEKIPPTERLCHKIEQKGFADGLYYETEGEGCPLLLINGGPGATHHYFHPSFSRAKSFSKIIYYDQAGCGLSRKNKSYSLDKALQDIETLREKLGVEKWFVFGHSYGGLLAQLYSLKHPDRVSGLILCCASPGLEVKLATSKEKDSILTKCELEKINEIKTGDLAEDEKYFNILLNGGWKKHYFKKPDKKRMAEMSLYDYEADPELVARIDKEMETVSLQGKFTASKIPTLIIEAEKDLVWHQGKIEKLRQNHPGMELILMQKSRHYPFEDEPGKLFKVLEGFMRDSLCRI